MAHFLIAGTMAWDRPLYLNRPLSPGSRARAVCELSDASRLPRGRLGGGGANAASALVNAGHHVTMASVAQKGPVGDDILSAAEKIGIDVSFVQRADWSGHVTLILIDPNGERIVLGLQSASDTRTKKVTGVLDAFEKALAAAQAQSPFDGLFLRTGDAVIPEGLEGFDQVVLTHGPISKPVPSDYIVTSQDDLQQAGREIADTVERMSALAGSRFRALIVTEGRHGGAAYTDGQKINYEAPIVKQVDATGAGDCFAAGFLDAICNGGGLVDALNHGARWGADTASRKGSTVDAAERVYRPYSSEET